MSILSAMEAFLVLEFVVWLLWALQLLGLVLLFLTSPKNHWIFPTIETCASIAFGFSSFFLDETGCVHLHLSAVIFLNLTKVQQMLHELQRTTRFLPRCPYRQVRFNYQILQKIVLPTVPSVCAVCIFNQARGLLVASVPRTEILRCLSE